MRTVVVSMLLALGVASVGQAQDVVDVDAWRLYLGPLSGRCRFSVGSGSPQSVVVGNVCDTYVRTDTPEVYKKVSGSGTNTGWLTVTTSTGTLDVAALATVAAGSVIVSGATPSWSSTPTFNGSNVTNLNASNVSSGNLAYARMPSGSGTWSATPTISGPVTLSSTLGVTGATTLTGGVASSIIPTASDTYDLGRYDKLVKGIYASTLNAIVYAETTATLFGGYSIIGKQAGSFAADVASAATTIDFGQTMTPNDWVIVRAHDAGGTIKAEYLKVLTLVSGTTYNVTRDLASAHGTDPAWASGTPYLVLGALNAGRIEMLAFDGKPRMLFTQQGSAYNTQNDRAIIGNLNGYFGYSSDIYGAAFGDAAATWLKIDPTNGLRIGNGGTTKVSIDASGNAAFTGTITSGSDVTISSASGTTYAAPSTYKFSRPGTLGGSGDAFGLWGADSSSTFDTLAMDNTMVPASGTANLTADVLLNSTGSLIGGSAAAPVSIRLRSAPVGTSLLGITMTGAVTTTSSIAERSRSVAMGDWTTRTFSSANYAAAGAGSSATVTSGETLADGYMQIGMTTWLACTVVGFTVSGAPADYIEVALPSGVVGQRIDAAAQIRTNGTYESGVVVGVAGETFVRVYRGGFGQWPVGTTNNDIRFTVPVPIS